MRDAIENLKKLPERCFAVMNDQVVAIRRGAREPSPAPQWPKDGVAHINQQAGVTPQQVQAMIVGVTMGWDADGADPDEHVAPLDRPPEEVGPFEYLFDSDVSVTIKVTDAYSEDEAYDKAKKRLEELVDALYDAELKPGITYGAADSLDLIETNDPRS